MASFQIGPPVHLESPNFKDVQQNGTYIAPNGPKTNGHMAQAKPANPYPLAKYGRIQLILGPMFSGKSTELLRKLRVFEIARHKCLVVKYAKDERYSVEKLATHHKEMRTAISAEKLCEIPPEKYENCTIIGIDEGQFFEDVVQFSVKMANSGKVVIIAALDGTFEQKPFEQILQLIPHAESVVKLSSVCMACFKEAAFSRRLNPDDKRVKVIGSEDAYAAVCRRCLLMPAPQFRQKLESLRQRTDSGSLATTNNSSNDDFGSNQVSDSCTLKSKRKLDLADCTLDPAGDSTVKDTKSPRKMLATNGHETNGHPPTIETELSHV